MYLLDIRIKCKNYHNSGHISKKPHFSIHEKSTTCNTLTVIKKHTWQMFFYTVHTQNAHIHVHTHPYERTHTYLIPISTSERLSRMSS